MADTNKQLLPHRGGVDKMTQGAGKNIVLASGELFIEYPNAGAGRGKCKIKIGDGVTAYSSLPYAIGDTSTDPITFTQGAETNINMALVNLASGKKLQELIGTTKQLGNLINTELITLNDENWYDDPDPNKNAHGIMLRADKTKLNGIQAGAEVNQNAFSTVSINSGSTTVNLQADSKTDKLTIKAGDNVTLTPDAASDTVTINAKDSVYTAGSGIDISDANVIKQIKLSATTTSGNNNATTVQFGASFKVPKIKFDTNGHMVSSEDVTLTIPTVGDSDEKVAQQAATDNADLRVLLSVTATDAGQIDVVKKQKDLTYNPNSKNLNVVKINGVEVGSSPKFTDNDTQYTAGVGMTLTGTVFKAKMKQDTASTLASNEVSAIAGKQYAVTPDKNGVLSVNVPWTDENTKYFAGGGINLNNGTFSNAGVRSVETGTTAGSIKVKTGDGDAVDVAVKDAASAIKSISRNGTTFTATRLNGSTFTFDQKDDNTTYTASDGVKLTGTNFTNSGVRAVVESTVNGNINVNTNGGTANVPIHGLGTAAYKADTYFATTGHSHNNATTAAAGFMSAAYVTKLNGIATGAEVNQNAFSTVRVTNGSTTTEIVADAKQDGIDIIAGSNITITPDANADKMTIAAVDTKYISGPGVAISSSNQLSSVDVVCELTNGSASGTVIVRGRNSSGESYSKNISVGGLKSAAYTESSAYATANHAHDSTYLRLDGGNSMTGGLTFTNNTSIKFSQGGNVYAESGKLYIGSSSKPVESVSSNKYNGVGSNIDFVVPNSNGTARFFHTSISTGNYTSIECRHLTCVSASTAFADLGTVNCAKIAANGPNGYVYIEGTLTEFSNGSGYGGIKCGGFSSFGSGSFTGNLTVSGNGGIDCTGFVKGYGFTTNPTSMPNLLIRVGNSSSADANLCVVKTYVTDPGSSQSNYSWVYCNKVLAWGYTDRNSASSIKYKENIKDLTKDVAEKILDINTVTFDYKKEYNNGKKNCIGVIAEDVEKVIPEAVKKDMIRPSSDKDEEELITIDYTRFIPYLIKMVQIQEERINELEEEIKSLKK